MSETTKDEITIRAKINAPVEKVWEYYTKPEHIVKWNSASPDWHTPRAENDLRVGGKFNFRMEARDQSQGFDFNGVYDDVVEHKKIEYTMEGGRKARVTFVGEGGETSVVVTFEAENENPLELQRSGWQSILDNFKAYIEK